MVKNLRYYLSALLVMASMTSFAQTVTFTAGTDKGPDGGTPANEVSMTDASGIITITATGQGSNNGGVFGRTDNYRFYKGSTATFAAKTGYKITKVVLTCQKNSGTAKTPKYSASCFTNPSVGTYTVADATANPTIGTWELATGAQSFTMSSPVNQVRCTKIEVTYLADGATIPTLATPTFSGSTQGLQKATVTISAEEGTVYYTLDGTEPTSSSEKYTAPFELTESKTVKAIAIKGEEVSYVASKKYIVVGTEHAGTEADPLTVAEALTAINAGYTETAVVKGVVKTIEEYNEDYKDINYTIADEGGTETLLVYAGKGLNGAEFASEDDLPVGSTVVVEGSLTSYKGTAEIFKGTLLSLTTPTGISSVETEQAVKDGKAYNLAGQRVGKNYRGVVIVNGKKYIRK